MGASADGTPGGAQVDRIKVGDAGRLGSAAREGGGHSSLVPCPRAPPGHSRLSLSALCATQPDHARAQVVVRIRPAGPTEPACLQHTGADTLTLLTAPEASHYSLDHVLGASAGQAQVHKVIGRPIVDNCLAGYNSTVIAYGQTGSGKVRGGGLRPRTPHALRWTAAAAGGVPTQTPPPAAHLPRTWQTHTMLGELPAEGAGEGAQLPAAAGLIPRTFQHLFARMRELEGGQGRPGRSVSFSLSCSLLEIYKEQVRRAGSSAACSLRRAAKWAAACTHCRAARPAHPSRSLSPLLHRSPTCCPSQAPPWRCGRTSGRACLPRGSAGTRWTAVSGAGRRDGAAQRALPAPSTPGVHAFTPQAHSPFARSLPAAAAVLRLLARGVAARHTAATRTNDVSSRSHMVGGQTPSQAETCTEPLLQPLPHPC